MKTMISNGRERALSMVEVLVAVFILLLLIAVILPSFSRCQCKAPRINCVNNLKQVALAFRSWAGDNDDKYPMAFYTTQAGQPLWPDSSNQFHYFQVLSNELSTPKIVICPSDPGRTAATNFLADIDRNKVSYFIGLNADQSRPEMFLAGDRNLTDGKPVRNGLLGLTYRQSVIWTKENHAGQGNVAMVDGSVAMMRNEPLDLRLPHDGATNWLLFP